MRYVVVLVYDRFYNVQEWIRCWKQSEQQTRLLVLHNVDLADNMEPYKSFCAANGVEYVSRRNDGMDIGALQDIARDRCVGFPQDMTAMLWCTDDVWPMSKTFATDMFEHLTRCDMVVALEVSDQIKRHIRTTAFVITKKLLERIQFPCDPVLTKNQCYQFEHRSQDAFFEQVNRLGGMVRVPRELKDAPLWDTDHRKILQRMSEHYKTFPLAV